MPSLSEAFLYPFHGLRRFLVASLALPGVTLGVLLLFAWGGLIEAEGGDLMTLFLMARKLLAIGLLVVAVPLLLLTGYWLRAVREVADGAAALPRRDRLGELLREGLVGLLVSGALCVLPFGLCIWALVQGSGGWGQPHLLKAVTDYVSTGQGAVLVLLMAFLFLLVPALWPLAMLRVALGRFVPVRWTYALVLAIIYLAHLAVTGVLGWLPFLWLPASVYFQLFTASLLGQYASSCRR